jgi:hypothetical protein
MQFCLLGWGSECTAASCGERYCQAGTETGEKYFSKDTVSVYFSQMHQEECYISETSRRQYN